MFRSPWTTQPCRQGFPLVLAYRLDERAAFCRQDDHHYMLTVIPTPGYILSSSHLRLTHENMAHCWSITGTSPPLVPRCLSGGLVIIYLCDPSAIPSLQMVDGSVVNLSSRRPTASLGSAPLGIEQSPTFFPRCGLPMLFLFYTGWCPASELSMTNT